MKYNIVTLYLKIFISQRWSNNNKNCYSYTMHIFIYSYYMHRSKNKKSIVIIKTSMMIIRMKHYIYGNLFIFMFIWYCSFDCQGVDWFLTLLLKYKFWYLINYLIDWYIKWLIDWWNNLTCKEEAIPCKYVETRFTEITLVPFFMLVKH